MNNNNTTNIQEAKICCQCMTFYANPKFGEFCSKCYGERKPSIDENSIKIEVPKSQTIEPPKTNENEIPLKKEELNEKESEIKKESRPIQV